MCKYYGSFDYCEYCNKGNRSCCVALENYKKQLRVVEELQALQEKYDNLASFIKTVAFKDLNPTMRRLLKRQARLMNKYIVILKRRLSIWVD